MRRCGLCDHEMTLKTCGYSRVGDDTLCHTNNHDCYQLWTEHHVRPETPVMVRRSPEGAFSAMNRIPRIQRQSDQPIASPRSEGESSANRDPASGMPSPGSSSSSGSGTSQAGSGEPCT